MRSEMFAEFHIPYLAIIALLIFFSVFVAIVVRTYKKSNKERYEALGSLPLNQKENP